MGRPISLTPCSLLPANKVGDAIHLPTGVPHLIRNTGKEVMRMACSFSSNEISSGVGDVRAERPG